LVMDPVLIDLQRRVKQAFDPLNILNPGKIFPDL
jgi:FAD/FMN-containing dehydrogenase